MENNTLATELLHEIKASAKRWFIIAIAELVIIVMIIGTFIWYLTLPVDESLVEREYICSTKTDSKGLKPYLNRKIIGFKLYNSFLDGVLIKLYLEAEKC